MDKVSVKPDKLRVFISYSRRVLAFTGRLQRRTAALSVLAVAVFLSLAAFTGLKRVEAQETRADPKQEEAQQTQAASDFINGTRLFLDTSTAHEGLKLLTRAAKLEDEARAIIRLTAAAQQNRFWVKATPPAKTPAPKTPPPKTPPPKTPAAESPTLPPEYARFSLDGKSFETISHATSADGNRVAVAVSDGEAQRDIRVRVFEDGEPVTGWFVPKSESDQWLFDVRVFLSPDGRFLATEREDWRSTSYIQVHDLSVGRPVGPPIRAIGKAPRYQNIGFAVVTFLSGRPLGYGVGYDDDARPYLLTGSERGDAALNYVDETETIELFRHRYDQAVVAAAVGGKKGEEIFVSFDASFKGKISGVNGDRSRHADIQAAFAPERIEIAPDGESIAIFGADGEAARFRLIAPSKEHTIAGPLVSGTAGNADASSEIHDCVGPDLRRQDREVSKRDMTFFERRDLTVSIIDGRTLTLKDKDGKEIASRGFTWPIVLVCAGRGTDALAIGFDNLNVEVWEGDLARQIGARIDPLSYFKGKRRPDELISAQLSDDGRKVLTVTHFYNPPNGWHYWIGLYEVATGLPLIDSLGFVGEISPYGVLVDGGKGIELASGRLASGAELPGPFLLLRPDDDARARLISQMSRIADRLPPDGAAE